jgi:glyoxylase-like metal-dependent hydrolase (beta-lactamase superfamily II)
MDVGYSGDVQVGGPAATREVDGLSITKVAVGPMDNNAYLLEVAGGALLIDAANEPERLLELVRDRPVRRIVTTHRHFDHWQALPEVATATGAPVSAHPADSAELPVPVTEPVDHGARIALGEHSLEVILIRGHTPGSIVLAFEGPSGAHLFTGDSLFPGGPGRTNSPADFELIMDDLEREVFGRFPDSAWVYPGHGKDTTLGAERPHLGEWRARGW